MFYNYYGKIIFKTIVWAVILTGFIITLAWSMVLCVSVISPELNTGLLVKSISLLLTVVIILKFHDVLLRYPFKKTFTARRIIGAPVEVVWEHIRPRARNKGYNALISSIRKVGDNVYRYYETSAKGAKKTFHDVKILEEVPHQVLEMDYTDEDSPHDMVKTCLGFLYTFEILDDDRTEVTITEVHRKPSFFTFYVLEFLGAHRDNLRQLACACEKQENISWASAQIAMEELASHPDAGLRDQLRPLGDPAIIVLTALITAVTMVFAWLVLTPSLLPPM